MIRVLLVDDEEHALDMLEILLSEIGNVVIAGKYTNPLKAIGELGRKQADAVFLDIDMPGMRGMDAARVIQSTHPNLQIVFTTAYAEYAIEAFEIQALDYLLKPVKMERLRNTVNRIEDAVTRRIASGSDAPMFICMGGFSVQLPSASPENKQLSWRTNKEKELCAFLVHHSGQPVDQAVIMEALWPDSDIEKARSYLYTCISLLRKNIRASGLPTAVNKSGNGYSLDMAMMDCDVMKLDELLDNTLKEEGLGAERLKRIAALYKGEYIGECDFGWAFGKREQLADKYVQALRKLYSFFSKNGQLESAMECLRRILSNSPDSEQDGRELIKLHMEAGNRNEAIKVYRQLELSVRDRLDVEMEEETVSLYRRLISSVSEIRRSL